MPFHPCDYSPYQLLVAGRALGADYDPADAVEHYVHLHPESDRDLVESELHADMARYEDAH